MRTMKDKGFIKCLGINLGFWGIYHGILMDDNLSFRGCFTTVGSSTYGRGTGMLLTSALLLTNVTYLINTPF